VKGHSVMNGYLNKNNMVFKNDYVIIQKWQATIDLNPLKLLPHVF
jgi:hypothetical protein